MSAKLHFIQSGQIHLAEIGEEIATILGTCVALCVYDPKLGIAGMCHYLLPADTFSGSGNRSITENPFNFGDFAIPTLLGLFKKRGSDRNDLQVSILGGSVVGNGDLAVKVATENIACAERWIERLGLNLHKKKTGLPEGMQVRISATTGGIYLKKISSAEIETIAAMPSPHHTSSSLMNPKPGISFAQPASSFSKTEPVLRTAPKVDPIVATLPDKIRVLIVDDSKTIRRVLRALLESCPNIQVIGEAADAFEAESLRSKFKPDVMTLDIHMPEKDGVAYLEEVLSKDPLPVVMVSDLSLKEASPVMQALELGAFDYMQKPAANELSDVGPELINIIKTAYESRKKVRRKHLGQNQRNNQIMAKKLQPPSSIKVDAAVRLVAIGASTGGPEAIRTVLGEFPEKCPPIVIVQHMPPMFTRTFAESLNLSCRIRVKEAADGDVLEDSTAYIAPGGFQMAIIERGGRYRISINNEAPVNRFKPSVDYMFDSLERLEYRGQIRVALLTGMGSDGAYGMLALKRKGYFTIAQDEESCVVYGMPRAAVEYDAVEISLPLREIGEALLSPRKKYSKNSA